jgi:Arm DNA-binding domain
MPLTDTTVRSAMPGAKPRKLADERGLYLLINPNGSKLCRLKYRVGRKEKVLALGSYPEAALGRALDEWLASGDLVRMHAILDDRERLYYEHRKAA